MRYYYDTPRLHLQEKSFGMVGAPPKVLEVRMVCSIWEETDQGGLHLILIVLLEKVIDFFRFYCFLNDNISRGLCSCEEGNAS